jgi:hypothetical protein
MCDMNQKDVINKMETPHDLILAVQFLNFMLGPNFGQHPSVRRQSRFIFQSLQMSLTFGKSV